MERLLTLGLLATLLLAGCIEVPQDPDAPMEHTPQAGGSMSADETRQDTTGLCTQELGLGTDDRFCATRTITVAGTLSGFDLLDVDLSTFNGDVVVKEGAEGEWGFVATLTARGATANEAMQRIEDIQLEWAHEDARGHFVHVEARHDGDTDSREARIELTMPRSVALRLVASTSNGDAVLEGGRTDGLALTTSNGDILAQGDVTQVSLTTSNGAIDARLRPTSDARWSLTTSNGDITLAVPEGPTYGYEMHAATSNGEVDYTMRDGDEGPCPQGSEYYTPPCNERSFTTRGFASRDVQVRAQLATSNGEIQVAPS